MVGTVTNYCVTGGPSVRAGYQSLSSTFSGVAPSLDKLIPSSGLNESHTENLSVEHVYMMSGHIPNPDPQSSNLPPGGHPQGSNLLPGGQPQGQYTPQG